jgi:ABC-type sugar transport system permease subunit
MSALRRSTVPWSMLAPGGVAFAAIVGYPLYRAAYWAVHSGRGGDGEARFVGVGNFVRLFGDRAVLLAGANTLAFAMAYVLLVAPLSLSLALLLNRERLVGRGVLRLMFFSSHLIGGVYVAGIVTSALGGHVLGVEVLAIPWLTLPVLLAASVWTGVGLGMVYLLAALQAVDLELLDAARVDGAGAWQRFRRVTWPAIAPTAAFIALMAGVGGLQLFELPFVLYQGTGPANSAVTISMMLFSAGFEQGDLGYASAIGWSLAGLVGVVSVGGVRLAMRETGGAGETGGGG